MDSGEFVYEPFPEWCRWEPVEPWDAPRLDNDTLAMLYGDKPPKSAAQLAKLKQDVLAKVAADPWYWFKNFVVTQDEDDPQRPWKPFPGHYYLFALTKLFMSCRLLSAEKARQMMFSWWSCGCHLWEALYHNGRNVIVQSKRQEDADELLARMRFIFEQLPPFLATEIVPLKEFKTSFFRIRKRSSRIRAYPQGPHQVRMQTSSAYFGDETAFQEEFEAAYCAMYPSLNRNGKATLISTAEHSFARTLHYDQFGGKRRFPDPDAGKEYVLMRRNGIPCMTVVKNHNRFVAVNVDWPAHPARDEAWAAETRAGMPEWQWQKEYLRNPDARSGSLVFDMFDPTVHVIDATYQVAPWASWYEGLDHGRRVATAAVWVAVDNEHDCYVWDEYYMPGRQIADNVKGILAQRADKVIEGTWCDPSMTRRLDNAESTVIEEYGLNGLHITPSDNNMDRGIEAISLRLMSTLARWCKRRNTIHPYFAEKGVTDVEQLTLPAHHDLYPNAYLWDLPALYIHPRCTNLIREIQRWIWKPQSKNVQRNEPDKPIEQDDHSIDALRYVLVQNPSYTGIPAFEYLPARLALAADVAHDMALAELEGEEYDPDLDVEEYLHARTMEILEEGAVGTSAALKGPN